VSIEILTLLFFGSLIVVLLTGLPLVFCLGGVAAIFVYILFGFESLQVVVWNTFGVMMNTAFIAIPLFVFMGLILQRAGIAEALYEAMHRIAGSLKGGLAVGTTIISTLFAAMTGLSAPACITMGLVALPSMRERGYNKYLAIGCIAGPSTLGILIPPSIVMILLAIVGRMSVGKLFMAGIIPGLIISSLFILCIIIIGLLWPHLCPSVREKYTLWQKIESLKSVIMPILIILAVLGSIFCGIATPTEASAVGAFACIIAAGIQRRLNWQVIKESTIETFKITVLSMWVAFGAVTFSALYSQMGGVEFVRELILGLCLGRWGVVITIMGLVFFLGCFLDNFAIILLVIPICIPIIRDMGFDPIWFGILFVINTQTAYNSPPFGYNLFYLKAVVPQDITLKDIYVSVIIPIIIMLIGLALVMAFPKLALWLPSIMLKPG